MIFRGVAGLIPGLSLWASWSSAQEIAAIEQDRLKKEPKVTKRSYFATVDQVQNAHLTKVDAFQKRFNQVPWDALRAIDRGEEVKGTDLTDPALDAGLETIRDSYSRPPQAETEKPRTLTDNIDWSQEEAEACTETYPVKTESIASKSNPQGLPIGPVEVPAGEEKGLTPALAPASRLTAIYREECDEKIWDFFEGRPHDIAALDNNQGVQLQMYTGISYAGISPAVKGAAEVEKEKKDTRLLTLFFRRNLTERNNNLEKLKSLYDQEHQPPKKKSMLGCCS